MNIKEELMIDLKDAMRNKNQIKKDTVTLVRAAILQVEKDDQKVLTDDEIIEIVAREMKKRKEAKKEYEKTDRKDIVESLEEEIGYIEKYLPAQLTEDEITELVKNAIAATGASTPREMGKVMKEIKPLVVGKADGKLVSDIVKKLLV
ncbi:MAG: GatB/YqeY domain-containing protein [Clostridia bacterium]